MTTVTVAELQAKAACPDQVEIIRKEWGDGEIPITRDNLLRAVELGLDLSWYARNWLPPSLWAEYARQRALLWAEYARQRVPLRAEYERQVAPLRAEYDRQRTLLWAEYARQVALLWAEYDRQRALLLYALIAPQGETGGEK